MRTANFTEVRKHAAQFLDEVEKGEIIRILRHGKAVADLTPVISEDKPSWEKMTPRLPLSGVFLSRAILQNRKDAAR